MNKSRGIRAIQVIAMGWMLVFFTGHALGELEPLGAHPNGVVAIDPGHGGQDNGASGPTGLLEKTVALELARLLALELETEYRVTLTRSGDYDVEPHQRTAIGNHASADLMISLHAGADFRHTTQGQAIYYHTGSDETAVLESDLDNTGTQRSWHQTQTRHTQASQALAKIMKQQLEKIPTQGPCHIQNAPLVILQGADLPAILIEIGHLTNPDTEKNLATPEHVALIVTNIADGIHQFMDQHVKTATP